MLTFAVCSSCYLLVCMFAQLSHAVFSIDLIISSTNEALGCFKLCYITSGSLDCEALQLDCIYLKNKPFANKLAKHTVNICMYFYCIHDTSYHHR